MNRLINVIDFGAVGDGRTDCTAAIQAAIDAAGKETYGGAVYIPAGVYLTGEIKMHPHVHLQGETGWSIRNSGGSVLKLNDDSAACLLNITGCFGCTVTGLVLDGGLLGEHISGVMFKREDFFDHPEEDTFRIESCQIKYFSGDGVFLQYACAFSIRYCQIMDNEGDGIFFNSWDGFLLDNWLSANRGWGIRCADEGVNNAAMTLTGNRIEGNYKGGLYIKNARLWQITGNYFDRSGGPGIYIAAGTDKISEIDSRWQKITCHCITVTGNIFNRSGANLNGTITEKESCHIWLEECFNVTVSGNTYLVGMNDNDDGILSPQYGMVIDRLKGYIITQNNMYKGFLKEQYLDLGGHGEQVILEGNVGCPVPKSDFKENGNISPKW